MGQERQGGEGRRPARQSPAFDPRAQRQREEGQPRKSQACREHAPPEPGLHPTSQVRGQDERQERGRQREPPIADHASEEDVSRDAGGQEDDAAQEAIDRLDRRLPEERRPDRGPQECEAGRVELELRVTAPPVGVPVRGPRDGRQRASERVPEPEELPRVIVEGRNASAERGPREGTAVEEEQEERHLSPQRSHWGIVLSSRAETAGSWPLGHGFVDALEVAWYMSLVRVGTRSR